MAISPTTIAQPRYRPLRAPRSPAPATMPGMVPQPPKLPTAPAGTGGYRTGGAQTSAASGTEIPGTLPPPEPPGGIPPTPPVPPGTPPGPPEPPGPPPTVIPPPAPLPPPIVTPPITPPTSPVGSNLRGEIYAPGDDPRLKGAQDRTDAAATGVTNINRNALQSGNEDRYRSIYGTGQVSGTMDELNGAPDRTALAMQKLKDFDAVSNEQRFNEERDLGRNISKFGRSGMQANADNFGDIQRRIAGDRGRLANELASSVSEGDINDRFRKVDMNTGLAERNADRGFQRGKAAIDTASGQTDRSIDDSFDQLNAADSLESRIFGQGQSNRGEMRTERENQNKDAQQTIENRIREMEAQNSLEDLRLRRAALQAQAGGR